MTSVSVIPADSSLSTAVNALNALISAAGTTIRDDDTLRDAIIEQRHFNSSLLDLVREAKDGSTILSGTGEPSQAVGVNGDYFLDIPGAIFWGPKTAGSWPSLTIDLNGSPGDPGPQGPPSVTLTYIYTQGVPATVWDVEHMLGRYPSLEIVDSAGTVVEGDVQYLNDNAIRLTFSVAFSGKAYLTY